MGLQGRGLWGEHALAIDQSVGFQLGPLALQLSRCVKEWRISYSYDSAWQGDDGDVSLVQTIWPEALEKIERYMFRATGEAIHLLPMLADRPIVSRPITPIHLPSGEEVTLFVSSPVWVGVAVDGGKKRLLALPIIRPSDTWFGPNTFDGELCYDSRTRGLLSADEVVLRIHRAITPVLIYNRADSDLMLERISIPVPLLSLYGDQQGQLWTEAVTLLREEDNEMAALKIGHGAPNQAGKCELFTEPRQRSGRGLFYRAFSSLF